MSVYGEKGKEIASIFNAFPSDVRLVSIDDDDYHSSKWMSGVCERRAAMPRFFLVRSHPLLFFSLWIFSSVAVVFLTITSVPFSSRMSSILERFTISACVRRSLMIMWQASFERVFIDQFSWWMTSIQCRSLINSGRSYLEWINAKTNWNLFNRFRITFFIYKLNSFPLGIINATFYDL